MSNSKGRKENDDAPKSQQGKRTQEIMQEKRLAYSKQQFTALLSAYVSPVSSSPPVLTRQHVISAALLCLDPAVDGAVRGHVMKGRGPLRYLMQLPPTHPLHSIMLEYISTVLAHNTILRCPCRPCNLSTAALSSAQLDLIQQHLQDYI